MAGSAKRTKKRVQHRVPADLDERAEALAKDNRKGFTSKSDVTTHALRVFLDAEEAEERRRALYEAWVANGRKWPPPPGLQPDHQP